MSLQDWANLGEIVGAVGVIASLLYLAAQVKQAQRVARAENVREVQEKYTRLALLLAENGELARIFRAGCEDIGKLDAVEQDRFNHLMGLHLLAFIEIHTARAGGLMDEDLYERWRNAIAMVMRSPGASVWWDAAHGLFQADAVRALDEARRRVGPMTRVMDDLRERLGAEGIG